MATLAEPMPAKAKSLAPDRFERFLAVGAVTILGATVVAIARGRADWGEVGPVIWAHLATVGVALGLTPFILLRRRGGRVHKRLGIAWAVALFATAAVSFGIREIRDGALSPIHLLSAYMLFIVPVIVWSARTKRMKLHRFTVRGTVLGALLIAGFFTFPFNRLHGGWLFG